MKKLSTSPLALIGCFFLAGCALAQIRDTTPGQDVKIGKDGSVKARSDNPLSSGKNATPRTASSIDKWEADFDQQTKQILQKDGYEDLGNGTVLDKKTGLQWMRCSLGQVWEGNNCSGAGIQYHHYHITKGKVLQEFNSKIQLAGFSDWRLPTVTELSGLVRCTSGKRKPFNESHHSGFECDGSYDTPTINNATFPNALSRPGYSDYWTNSLVHPDKKYDEFEKFYVSFKDGMAFSNKAMRATGSAQIRLVREISK